MRSILLFIRTRLVRTFRTLRRHPFVTLVCLVLLAGGIYALERGNGAVEEASSDVRIPVVEVATIAALSEDTAPLIVLGEVRSVRQAELRPDKPGEVTRVNVRVGQTVAAGTILAEVENGAERAAVVSAQGALAAAEAGLAKARAGARAEDRVSATVQAQNAGAGLASAQDAAQSAIAQSFTLAEDAVLAKTDRFFSNPYTVRPSLRVRSASYDERLAIENERVALGELIRVWRSEATSGRVPPSELLQRLELISNRLTRIKTYLNTLSGFISKQPIDADLDAATKSAQEAAVAGAQSSIDAARASITGATQGLSNAAAALRTSTLSESRIQAGERPEDIAVAQAAVTQARGGLAQAVAGLERSLIRTPIAGTVTTLSITRGGHVTGQDVVAVVANEGGLEVEGYLSQNALVRASVGMPVLVGGTYRGSVTTLSPGLDPGTKRARFTVALPRDAQFVNGEYVELALMSETSTSSTKRRAAGGYALPITAIKVAPSGLVVFTVTEANTLEALPITEGPIVGSSMLITDLGPETRIVKDARGLSAGDVVTVSTE